ncbi:MAG: D-alanine--D-alanine ligase, partial [Armatimonadetes bacterium]|nr:D-alanine--D-alanine ligase [Armatimonadota bacterium]
MSRFNVVVLMGGRSEEREVSLSTGRMILSALDASKYYAYGVDTAIWDTDAYCEHGGESSPEGDTISLAPLSAVYPTRSSTPKPDVAFIALHGKYGEDGTVQGFLELFDIPYVGSGVLASALAMDKIAARKMLEYHGIRVPKGFEVANNNKDSKSVVDQIESDIGFPVVIKPSKQGSTIGLSIAHSPEDVPSAIELASSYDDQILIEEFVEGIEITVPVIGYREVEALPVVEIVPESGFYDYHAKYTPGATEEIVPARISESAEQRVREAALTAHRAIGADDISRSDFIITPEDVIYVGTLGGGVFVSTDDADHFRAANEGLKDKTILALAVASDGTLFAGTADNGIFRSTDGGATWQGASTGLESLRVFKILPTGDGELLAGTFGAGIFRSTDGGMSWSAANQGVIASVVPALAVRADGTLVAAASARGLFLSRDRGESYQLALPRVEALALAVTRGGTFLAGTSTGLLLSRDGQTWTLVGLANLRVLALLVAPNGDLFAGTQLG